MDNTVLYLDFDNDDMYSGMDAISFVDKPAIKIDWFAFSKDGKKTERFNANEKKQIITSPVMVAETEIERYSNELGTYYVKFSAETIRKMRDKYFVDGKQNNVNFDHNSKRKAKGVYMVESFIVGEHTKSELFTDVPDGTWIASFYIEDKKQYDEIVKSKDFNGFSLEGHFIEKYEMNLMEEKKEIALKEIKEVFNSDLHEIVKLKRIQAILSTTEQ